MSKANELHAATEIWCLSSTLKIIQVPLIVNYLSDSTFFIVGMQLSGRVYYLSVVFRMI